MFLRAFGVPFLAFLGAVEDSSSCSARIQRRLWSDILARQLCVSVTGHWARLEGWLSSQADGGPAALFQVFGFCNLVGADCVLFGVPCGREKVVFVQ